MQQNVSTVGIGECPYNVWVVLQNSHSAPFAALLKLF